jgi:hypothetical protein
VVCLAGDSLKPKPTMTSYFFSRWRFLAWVCGFGGLPSLVTADLEVVSELSIPRTSIPLSDTPRGPFDCSCLLEQSRVQTTRSFGSSAMASMGIELFESFD